MSWNDLPAGGKALAVTILTPKQLEVFKLELSGMSQRDMAHALNISRGSVRDRLDAAYRALRLAGVSQDGSGHWAFPATEPKESA